MSYNINNDAHLLANALKYLVQSNPDQEIVIVSRKGLHIQDGQQVVTLKPIDLNRCDDFSYVVKVARKIDQGLFGVLHHNNSVLFLASQLNRELIDHEVRQLDVVMKVENGQQRQVAVQWCNNEELGLAALQETIRRLAEAFVQDSEKQGKSSISSQILKIQAKELEKTLERHHFIAPNKGQTSPQQAAVVLLFIQLAEALYATQAIRAERDRNKREREDRKQATIVNDDRLKWDRLQDRIKTDTIATSIHKTAERFLITVF